MEHSNKKQMLTFSELFSFKRFIEYISHRFSYDIIRMVCILIQKNVEIPLTLTAHELHDWATQEVQRLNHENQEITYTDSQDQILEYVNSELMPTYKLEFVEDTHELLKWGRDMDHCIGSYTECAIMGESLFLGLFNHLGQLIFNIQLSPDCIVQQFQGKRNCDPGPELSDWIKTLLKKGKKYVGETKKPLLSHH